MTDTQAPNLDDLTDRQRGLLEALIDLENDQNWWLEGEAGENSTREDRIGVLEQFSGYYGFDAHYELSLVADVLYAASERELTARGETERRGGFAFGFQSSYDGEITGATVSVYLGYGADSYLTKFVDTKHLTTDRSATGVRAAIAYAEALDNTYRILLARARDNGVLPT